MTKLNNIINKEYNNTLLPHLQLYAENSKNLTSKKVRVLSEMVIGETKKLVLESIKTATKVKGSSLTKNEKNMILESVKTIPNDIIRKAKNTLNEQGLPTGTAGTTLGVGSTVKDIRNATSTAPTSSSVAGGSKIRDIKQSISKKSPSWWKNLSPSMKKKLKVAGIAIPVAATAATAGTKYIKSRKEATSESADMRQAFRTIITESKDINLIEASISMLLEADFANIVRIKSDIGDMRKDVDFLKRAGDTKGAEQLEKAIGAKQQVLKRISEEIGLMGRIKGRLSPTVNKIKGSGKAIEGSYKGIKNKIGGEFRQLGKDLTATSSKGGPTPTANWGRRLTGAGKIAVPVAATAGLIAGGRAISKRSKAKEMAEAKILDYILSDECTFVSEDVKVEIIKNLL